MIFRLDEHIWFPDPELAEEDGLLAAGGDLSVDRLLLAYEHGIFPWYNEDSPILWYSPHDRFVLFPDELKISKSMGQVLRSRKFRVTMDQCFADVMEACSMAPRKGQDGTWINPDMKAAYKRLYDKGHAHSVEVWLEEELVGGFYGVHINNVFCGESMFSKVSNASKTALIWLCQSGLYQLIDCQLYTEHLNSMGARMISREEYMQWLQE
jgi:leucyl/phenylalanyl-tRNA---protein transferase